MVWTKFKIVFRSTKREFRSVNLSTSNLYMSGFEGFAPVPPTHINNPFV